MTQAHSSGAESAAPNPPSDAAPVAVLLCGYGEVERNEDLVDYNARSLRLLVSKSVRIPDAVVPYLSRRLARRATAEYEAADDFHSPHNQIFERQRAGIEAALKDQVAGDVRVFKAFNFMADEVPELVLPTIRQAGYERVVVVPLLVVDSIYTGGLSLEQVNRGLAAEPEWLPALRYLPSFFERPEFHALLADHVREAISPLRDRLATSQIGVVLLNHGCPYKAKGFETGIRESRLLFHGVRNQLIAEFPSLSIGWMNHPTPGRWTQPAMLQAARNLVTTGAQAIVFAPIGFVTDNHETMLDVAQTAKKLGPGVETLQLTSLNDDPRFLRMAASWIAPLVEDVRAEVPRVYRPDAGAATPARATVVPAGASRGGAGHSHSHGPGTHRHAP